MHAPITRAALFAICVLTQAVAQGPSKSKSNSVPVKDASTVLPDDTLADETYARDLAALNKRQREYAEQIQQRLQSLGTDLRLVAMIPNLENRYGSFADIDGDGDLDYIATEMTNAKQEVRLHRSEIKNWRRSSARSRGIDKKQPLIPHFFANVGRGRRAVVLPVGWPPYVFILALSPNGEFVGKPRSLGEYLPRRLSQAAGIDNNPYVIESIEDATKTTPARIYGRMTDENARSTQDVRFVLTLLRDGTVQSEVKQVEPGPKVGPAPLFYEVVKSAALCEHESGERTSIIAREVADVNEDGIDDVVIFSGVLSAHVFPGSLRNNKLTFGKELGRGRDVPIEDLRTWFPVRLAAGDGEKPYATAARSQLARIGMRIDSYRQFDAVLTLRTERHKGWFLNYYATDAGLVPVQDYRSWWPHKKEHNPLIEEHRQSMVLDADHDRSPDMLSVHIGQQYAWLRPPPKERDMLPEGHTRQIQAGSLRCGIVHGLGERHDDKNRVLVQFDDDVQLPKGPNAGYPISVSRVPVYGRAAKRERYCVFFRPRKLGLFFEVVTVSPEVARRRQYEAWLRRGERRLEMQPHYGACDLKTCQIGEKHHQEVFDDAVALFRRGLPFADSARDKAIIWRNVARVHGRAGRLKQARRAYERFVMLAKTVEPLAAPHPDLVGLFADEAFRVLHGGWAKKWPVSEHGTF